MGGWRWDIPNILGEGDELSLSAFDIAGRPGQKMVEAGNGSIDARVFAYARRLGDRTREQELGLWVDKTLLRERFAPERGVYALLD